MIENKDEPIVHEFCQWMRELFIDARDFLKEPKRHKIRQTQFQDVKELMKGAFYHFRHCSSCKRWLEKSHIAFAEEMKLARAHMKKSRGQGRRSK